MSILGNIISTIFGHGAAQTQPKPASGSTAASPSTAGASPAPTGSPAAPQPQVDVEAVLKNLASQNREKLDWRKSIVDLMKLLKLDSSLPVRQELA